MAPPPRIRPLRKDVLPAAFQASKTSTYSESAGGRTQTTLAPNIRSLSWSPTGALLAHSTSVNIRVWDAERAEVRASTELRDGVKGGAHGKIVERIAFNPRVESTLASTGVDGMVKLWDIRMPGGATGTAGGGGMGPRGGTTSKSGEFKLGDEGLFLTWHPSGTELLVGRRDDVVHAIDVRNHSQPLLDVTSTLNATASSNPTLRYDLTTTDRTPPKTYGNFNQMTFSNSGAQLLATTHDGPVVIYAYPSMTPLHTLRAHPRDTYAVRHSPLGNYVAVGASDSMITLWDTDSWLCMHTFMNHTSAVRDLSFSFDGVYLVAGSGVDGSKDGDKGLEIYHCDTGELVHTVDTVNTVTWAAWHPLRYCVAYAGDPGGVKVVGPIGSV